jgi:hypothetical protein
VFEDDDTAGPPDAKLLNEVPLISVPDQLLITSRRRALTSIRC